MKKILEIIKKIIGVILIIAGVLGLFLPFFQGILMILLGLALLGNHKLKNWFIKLIDKIKKK